MSSRTLRTVRELHQLQAERDRREIGNSDRQRKFVSSFRFRSDRNVRSSLEISAKRIEILEENVRRSDALATRIREKVRDLVEFLRREEKKLLENVEDFRSAERKWSEVRFFFGRTKIFSLVQFDRRKKISTGETEENQRILFDFEKPFEKVKKNLFAFDQKTIFVFRLEKKRRNGRTSHRNPETLRGKRSRTERTRNRNCRAENDESTRKNETFSRTKKIVFVFIRRFVSSIEKSISTRSVWVSSRREPNESRLKVPSSFPRFPIAKRKSRASNRRICRREFSTSFNVRSDDRPRKTKSRSTRCDRKPSENAATTKTNSFIRRLWLSPRRIERSVKNSCRVEFSRETDAFPSNVFSFKLTESSRENVRAVLSWENFSSFSNDCLSVLMTNFGKTQCFLDLAIDSRATEIDECRSERDRESWLNKSMSSSFLIRLIERVVPRWNLTMWNQIELIVTSFYWMTFRRLWHVQQPFSRLQRRRITPKDLPIVGRIRRTTFSLSLRNSHRLERTNLFDRSVGPSNQSFRSKLEIDPFNRPIQRPKTRNFRSVGSLHRRWKSNIRLRRWNAPRS